MLLVLSVLLSVVLVAGCEAQATAPAANELRSCDGLWTPEDPWAVFLEFRPMRASRRTPPRPDAVTARTARITGAVRVEIEGRRLQASFDSVRIVYRVFGGMTGGREGTQTFHGAVVGTLAARDTRTIGGHRVEAGTLTLPDSATVNARLDAGGAARWADAGTRLVGAGALSFAMRCRADTLLLDAPGGGRLFREVRYVRASTHQPP